MNKLNKKRERRKFFLFISPWLIGVTIFTFIPMAMSFYFSLTDWEVLKPANFIGIKNYLDLFKDPLFYQSIKVTITYTAIVVPLNVFISLLIALLLNSKLRYIGLFRLIYYLPAVLSGVVVSVLWGWLFNYNFGLINDIIGIFGVQGPKWLTDPNWIMPTLIIMSLWGVGGGIIMYLAGLQAVPESLYQAAEIDGAGFWQKFRNITLPSMSPMILFSFLTSMIGTLQTFTQAYVLSSGGPNNASLFYALYLYKNGFEYRKMGKACAMAWILFVIILILSILVLKVTKNNVYYENDEGGKII